MKATIKNRGFLMYSENILHRDEDFLIYRTLVSDRICIIPRKEKRYNNIGELPEYVKDIIIREEI